MTLRIGLIGAGGMGRAHVERIEQELAGGRIVAVADVFDALSTKRPYKPAFPTDRCFAIMEEERGTHFDPVVLDAFLARRQDIIHIQMEYVDIA